MLNGEDEHLLYSTIDNEQPSTSTQLSICSNRRMGGWRVSAHQKRLTKKMRWPKSSAAVMGQMLKRLILRVFRAPFQKTTVSGKIMVFEDIGDKISELHWITAAFFLVAAMAGGGVVAIPLAMLQSGTIAGVILMLFICAAFFYTSHLLGQNWLIMCKQWPNEYNLAHCRKPYPEMAYRALGAKAKLFTSIIVNESCFGTAVVYLLLSAKIVNEFVASFFGFNIGSCLMVLFSVALLPVTFLKSPQDFWWTIVTAMLTTTFSVILILIGTGMDYKTCAPVASFPDFQTKHLVMSLGIYIFAFGGHSVVFCLYLPITLLGYYTYGDSLYESIINSIQSSMIQQAANLLIAIHCILTLTIVINPVNQDLEDFFKIPHHFGWQRILVRTSMMASIVFCAETVPSFGVILNLLGGTTSALTSAILPSLFYLCLNSRKDLDSTKNESQSFVQSIKIIWEPLFQYLAFTIFCGCIITYSAMYEILTTSLSVPCYLAKSSTAANSYTLSTEHPMHCCGPALNISRYGQGQEFCPLARI